MKTLQQNKNLKSKIYYSLFRQKMAHQVESYSNRMIETLNKSVYNNNLNYFKVQ